MRVGVKCEFDYFDSSVGIVIDNNALCFNGAGCDANIDWNGTDLIFQIS